MDLALQCAPDHPWVNEHPEWFTTRADGTIAYAENPPKKYQDIYPLNFDNDPEGIRDEVLRVVLHWVAQGVKIFRVDNPHTKPLELLAVADRQGQGGRPGRAVPGRGVHPAGDDARPRQDRLHPVVHVLHLAHDGLGDARSTARSWSPRPTTCGRTSGRTRRTSCTRRCSTAARRCSRSGRCWPACCRRPGACTPGYELFEHVPRPGAEEYLDNEKFELRPRDWAGGRARPGGRWRRTSPGSTQIRRENPALHWLRNLRFHEIDNGALLCCSKRDPETGNTVLVICSFDSANVQWGNTTLDMPALGLGLARPVHGDATRSPARRTTGGSTTRSGSTRTSSRHTSSWCSRATDPRLRLQNLRVG